MGKCQPQNSFRKLTHVEKRIAWQHFHIINFCKKAEKREIGENISLSKNGIIIMVLLYNQKIIVALWSKWSKVYLNSTKALMH